MESISVIRSKSRLAYLWGISHFGLASIFQTAMGTTGGATASVRISDALNNAWSSVYPLELSDAVQDRIQKGPGEGGEYYTLRYRLWNSWFFHSINTKKHDWILENKTK